MAVELEENPAGLTLVDLVLGLMEADPAVAVGQQEMPRGRLILNPMSLGLDHLELVIERFKSILAG